MKNRMSDEYTEIGEKGSKAAYICRNRGVLGYWARRTELGLKLTWKTLATPKFRLRAEIGGRELMNIGWEWGVLLPLCCDGMK